MDEPIELMTDDHVRLSLLPLAGPKGATPVLLLHGASAGHQTFRFPRKCNLVKYLQERGYEPWLLDWRGSKNVVEKQIEPNSFARDVFTLDAAAEKDISLALAKIIELRDPKSVAAIGHCMGAAILAQAIAKAHVKPEHRLTHVVLSTIGLFYEVPVDGRLKAEDHLLERLVSEKKISFIDPRCTRTGEKQEWPEELTSLYKSWPATFRPHQRDEQNVGGKKRAGSQGQCAAHIADTCNRLSFMYGEPYYEPALVPEIHSSEKDDELLNQFGPIPIRMYMQAAQNIRRGWAASYDASSENSDLITADCRKNFERLDRVTLITGAMNRLWHRDSIDRMYEWLKRGEHRSRDQYRKIVFPKNGHQDLLWGKNSWNEVFPRIVEGLPG